MNIKEYIKSGVLEEYVLGTLTEAERLNVETLAVKNAEVKAEIEIIERSFEGYAAAFSDSRASELKDNIVQNIEKPNMDMEPPTVFSPRVIVKVATVP